MKSTLNNRSTTTVQKQLCQDDFLYSQFDQSSAEKVTLHVNDVNFIVAIHFIDKCALALFLKCKTNSCVSNLSHLTIHFFEVHVTVIHCKQVTQVCFIVKHTQRKDILLDLNHIFESQELKHNFYDI